MTTSLESLYQQIGEAVKASIGEEWSSAWVSIEFATGVTSLEGGYFSMNEKQEKSYRVSRDLAALLKELHAKTQQAGQADWKRARFELQSDGNFQLNFEYAE